MKLVPEFADVDELCFTFIITKLVVALLFNILTLGETLIDVILDCVEDTLDFIEDFVLDGVPVLLADPVVGGIKVALDFSVRILE